MEENHEQLSDFPDQLVQELPLRIQQLQLRCHFCLLIVTAVQ